MKLHFPVFEKNLQHGVKAEIKRSPALKREYRKAKKAFRRHHAVLWLFLLRPLFSGIIGMAVLAMINDTRSFTPGLAIINLASFFSLCCLVQGLLQTLYRAPDLPALALLPVSERTIFRWELQKYLKRHAGFCLLDQCAGFGAVALCGQFSAAGWILPGIFAALSYLGLLALVALCAARLPRFPYSKVISSFAICGFILFVLNKVVSQPLVHFFAAAAPALNLILPTGWVPSLFQATLPGGSGWIFILLVPVILIIFTIRNSLRLLESRLQLQEPIVPQVPDLVPPPNEKPAAIAAVINQASNPEVTAIEETVQSRRFLIPTEPRGWFEERLWSWFTAREKILAGFVFSKEIKITRPWWLVLRNFLLTLSLGLVLGKVDPVFEYWVLGGGLFITFCQCLAQIYFMGSAFRGIFNSGVMIPLYAAYPITFPDLSGILFKSAVIQLPPFILYSLGAGTLITVLAGQGFVSGIIYGLKTGFLLFAARFILTIFAFSSGTNDTSKFHLRTFALVFIFLGGVILFLVLGAIGLFAPDARLAWFLWLAAIADAYAVFRIYRWFYDANRFDLMARPKHLPD